MAIDIGSSTAKLATVRSILGSWNRQARGVLYHIAESYYEENKFLLFSFTTFLNTKEELCSAFIMEPVLSGVKGDESMKVYLDGGSCRHLKRQPHPTSASGFHPTFSVVQPSKFWKPHPPGRGSQFQSNESSIISYMNHLYILITSYHELVIIISKLEYL